MVPGWGVAVGFLTRGSLKGGQNWCGPAGAKVGDGAGVIMQAFQPISLVLWAP